MVKSCSAITLFLMVVTGVIMLFAKDTSAMNKESERHLNVVISKQKMYLYEKDTLLKEYSISTSKFGIGNKAGSNQTPLGKHRVAIKIGDGAPKNTIFRNRANSGKLADINYDSKPGKKDLITSRILWLEGLEEGINKGDGIDSHKRYIYIHGTSDEGAIGKPASNGCIRMYNKDVIELYDLVNVGTEVYITE
ncbi:MAG: L,D-transpeptidase [Candidatus Auribacter fodinae]|jgi:hypothetical protein|uniref:L,D-transpeptidase n=1 Tax=Candidatus Auribacter fodinae TaxID=2093366 RepID=A0A3A4R3C5_9BACT|nr:MAG: L,D-transpeptidase [Candidatus Auribacter fodinae]